MLSVLITFGKEHLHADANTEERFARLDMASNSRIQTPFGERRHRCAERPITRQNCGARARDLRGVVRDEKRRLPTRQRRAQRAHIAATVIDDGDPIVVHAEYFRHPARSSGASLGYITHMRRLLSLVALTALAATLGPQRPVSAQGELPKVPAGFTISVVATVPYARELSVAPNGDLFVGTYKKSVYVVPTADETPGEPKEFIAIDDGPTAGVLVHGDTLYVGGQFGVYTIPYHVGDRSPRGAAVKIASVRTNGVSSDHVTTTLAFTQGNLFASVGSSCNFCDPELDATRATIQEMKPDGSGIHPRAEHIRNAIALTVNPDTGMLWAGVAGQDELEHGHPYEIVDAITSHPGTADYGWPYCYENRKPVKNAKRSCESVAVPRIVLPAYDTPIGAAFYPTKIEGPHAFPKEYRGGLFVALHGSWHTPPVPPRVAFIPMHGDEPVKSVDWSNPDHQWTEFLGGLQHADGSRNTRPTGVAVGPKGDLFVSDDKGGKIYRIRPESKG